MTTAGVFLSKEENAHHPPSGLAAISAQKFGRRQPGTVRSRTSVFIVPNVVAGLGVEDN